MSDYRYQPEQSPVFKGNYPRTVEEMAIWQQKADVEPVVDPDLPIVDAHHHLWDNFNGQYLIREITDDIRQSGHNVISTVHVQAHSMMRASGPEELKCLGETEFLSGIAAMSDSGRYGPTRVCEGIVGYVDFRLGERVGAILDQHMLISGGRFRGIRQGLTWTDEKQIADFLPSVAQHKLMSDPDFRKGFAQLAPRDLSFDAWLFHPQIAELVDLANAFPDTRIVLNHIGGRLGIGSYAFRFKDEFVQWQADLKRLAQCPNVYIKIGGLGMVYGGFGFHIEYKPLNSDDLVNAWSPFAQAGIDAFGPQRVIMESNFPVDKQCCTYQALWNALKKITASYSADERNRMFNGAAREFYRLV